jgi:hypothetical protein
MPDSNYYALNLGCDRLETNSIKSERFKINNSERPLEIKNDEGKVVFFVDNLGANVQTINSTTSFFELVDTPNGIGIENSLISVKNEKLAFVNEINLPKINGEYVTSKSLVTDNVKSLDITSNSIKTESIIVDDVEATNLNVKNIRTDHIICNDMTIADFKTKTIMNEKLDCKNAKIESITSESITSNNLASTNIIVENLENQTGHITNLINETLVSNTIKSTSIDALQIVADKNVVSEIVSCDLLDTTEIKCNKLSILKSVYGTYEEPLDLAATRVKSVSCAGDLIIIHSKIPSGVINQDIIINGIKGDYVVNMTFNKINDVTHTFIKNGKEHLLRMKYKERVERDSQVKIIIQKV